MKIIIHGGFFSESHSNQETKIDKQEALKRIASASFEFLKMHSAVETVVYAVSQLENDELFNAGIGSQIQSDGKIIIAGQISDYNGTTRYNIARINGGATGTGITTQLGVDGKLLVFPNPASGIFTISLSEMQEENPEIRLVNSLGQVIYSGILQSQVQHVINYNNGRQEKTHICRDTFQNYN